MADEEIIHDGGGPGAVNCSERKRIANITNAKNSTGPRTPEGKAYSSRSAEKHRLTGVVLIAKGEGKEDEEAFLALRQGLCDSWRPVGYQEQHCVDLLSGDYWRLHRASLYEAGIIRKRTENKSADVAEARVRKLRHLEFEADLGLAHQTQELRHTTAGIDYLIEFLENVRETTKDGALGFTEADTKKIYGLFGQPCSSQGGLHCAALVLGIQKYWKANDQNTANELYKELEEYIDKEIQNLESLRAGALVREQAELEADLMMSALPPLNVVDNLDRHRNAIMRRIDRTIDQLERLQATRFRAASSASDRRQ